MVVGITHLKMMPLVVVLFGAKSPSQAHMPMFPMDHRHKKNTQESFVKFTFVELANNKKRVRARTAKVDGWGRLKIKVGVPSSPNHPQNEFSQLTSQNLRGSIISKNFPFQATHQSMTKVQQASMSWRKRK